MESRPIIEAALRFFDGMKYLPSMLRHLRFFGLIALLFAGFQGWSQLGGNTTYSFLNLTPSARVSALSQATLAGVESDLEFAWLNPALLREDHRGQISFGYVNVPGGVNAAEAAYGFGYGTEHNVMVGFRYVDYGTFNGTDVNGNSTGTFRATDQLLNAGYSYRLDSNWQFGTNVKLINSVYEQYYSFGLATDIAAVYQIPKNRFAFALVAKNIGFQALSYAGEREQLPFELQFAISNRFEHLPLRWTIQVENLQRWDLTYFDPNAVERDPITGEETYNDPSFFNKLGRHFSFSGDLRLGSRLNVQLGFSLRRALEMRIPSRRTSAGLTFGVGIRLSKFHLNYGNRYVHVAGRMHHLGISVDLNDFGS